MRISELLSLEFEEEVKKTRAMLERVPNGKTTFTPHPKSMPLGQHRKQPGAAIAAVIHTLRLTADSERSVLHSRLCRAMLSGRVLPSRSRVVTL
jgi:hypothetical protein